MNVLVLGGTRFFGIHMVNSLLNQGHKVTIATRGRANDPFGLQVKRIIIERTDPDSLNSAFRGKHYDVVCDNLAYCSNDVKYLLDNISCDRYVMTSSASVYKNPHINITEDEFNPYDYPLIWCNRADYPYDEAKRQAECALFQYFTSFNGVAVRFPYVIGEDDYTKRLYSYVEAIIKGDSLNIDNLDEKIGFISSHEAGTFLAWAAEQKFVGSINGCNPSAVSLREIIDYVQKKTGIEASLSDDGINGSYNGSKSFSLDVKYAESLGYCFHEIKPWIYQLLDSYIDMANKTMNW